MENRGGKRPGSGRPAVPADKKRILVNVSVSQETKRNLAVLRERGIHIGRHIDQLVNDLLEDSGK